MAFCVYTVLTMSSEFFFSLARISCAQIFRAHGIDRCPPSLLDTMTDILLRHLSMLASKCARNARLSGRELVVIQDVALAMEQIGLIYPHSMLDSGFDNEPVEEYPDEDTEEVPPVPPVGGSGIEEFISWAKGPSVAEAQRVARIPSAYQASGFAAQNTASATSKSTNENASATVMAAAKVEKDPRDTKSEDPQWLTALMKKQSRVMGSSEQRFVGTVLSDDSQLENDFRALGDRPVN